MADAKNKVFKSIWEGIRTLLVNRGLKVLLEWIIVSTVKDELVQEAYLIILEPLQDTTKILTDDDKDNSKQLNDYFVKGGKLRTIGQSLVSLAGKIEDRANN